jgi:hypothetical protein
MNILPGSKIVGASGKCLVVDRMEGEILICGDRRIKLSAVLKVEPPPKPEPPAKPAPLAVGDVCYYGGSKYWQHYGGMELKAFELREGYWTCEKPDGYRTTNIPPIELSRSPVEKPAKNSTANQPRKGQWLKDWEKENQPMQE